MEGTMEVYAIGGKPIMLDGKLCKVAMGGQRHGC
jgi:hypothetical protein